MRQADSAAVQKLKISPHECKATRELFSDCGTLFYGPESTLKPKAFEVKSFKHSLNAKKRTVSGNLALQPVRSDPRSQ